MGSALLGVGLSVAGYPRLIQRNASTFLGGWAIKTYFWIVVVHGEREREVCRASLVLE